jgi:hypothetical protein
MHWSPEKCRFQMGITFAQLTNAFLWSRVSSSEKQRSPQSRPYCEKHSYAVDIDGLTEWRANVYDCGDIVSDARRRGCRNLETRPRNRT